MIHINLKEFAAVLSLDIHLFDDIWDQDNLT